MPRLPVVEQGPLVVGPAYLAAEQVLQRDLNSSGNLTANLKMKYQVVESLCHTIASVVYHIGT